MRTVYNGKQFKELPIMDHFVIYTEDNPAPAAELPHYHYDEGNWLYRRNGNISVLAFEDEGEPITVWVAEPRRTATLDTVPDDVPFTINKGAYAL